MINILNKLKAFIKPLIHPKAISHTRLSTSIDSKAINLTYDI